MTQRTLHSLLVLALLCAVPAQSQLLRIYYPDIEQGSSTVVVAPNGSALVIDGGTGLKAQEDEIEHFINDLIDAGVISSVDYTIATHYDEDHIGRMENVYQLVPLDSSVVAYDRGEDGGTPSTFAYSDYEFGAEQFNRTTITANTTISLGGGVTVRCYVVNAELPDSSSVDLTGTDQQENARSVAMVVSYGDVDVWIGGDLTGNAEKNVGEVEQEAGSFVGDVDVYTFNHHGSETSSVPDFLEDLKAELGIAQMSASNNFGHPRAVVVQDFLDTDDTDGNTPIFIQQNPGDSTDNRSDDTLADGIADCDDTDGAYGLPGTLALYSDGTSYRVHACGVAPSAFSADEGTGTVGDYPPAVMRVLRSPQVPTSAQSVTVEADVEDLDGSVTVEIQYELDGVSQTPISMSLDSGVTYTGTIPSQTDGTQVRFRVAATDNNTQTELSAAQGYYSGTTDVADFRDNDTDGVLVPKSYGVRVSGNMTLEPGVLHTSVTQAFVQDSTGGVQIFDSSIDGTIGRGDEVVWVGELEQFGGATEINVASGGFGNYGHTRIGTGSVPSALTVTVANAGEAVEGELILIEDVTIVSGSIPASGSGNLTITDDGGTSTMTLRIDGDTDIPGANTPTQSFDVVGIASQFDSWVPLSSGYQIIPRERTDLDSEEVNHPQVLISEIHADPASGSPGDANGDGTRSATQDEFIELLNTGTTSVDISGWTLADGIQVRHTFAASTVIPPREAVVVFGGGTPTGDFGNAAANGLVFTASTGTLSLNNAGDTVTFADDSAVTVQEVTYNGAGGDDQSLVRDPDYTNAPMVKHSTATGASGALYSPGTRIDGQAFTIPSGALLLTEVLYDATGSDDDHEWVELYNNTASTIALDDLCIGAGGSDYTSSMVDLSGSVAAGETFVVGGETSDSNNANPTFDQAEDFSPDLQNSGSDADGVALFNMPCSLVTASTVPIDAVVYGTSNTNSLIDETGSANSPEVGDASSGLSIERTDVAGAWQIQGIPSPGEAFPDPPPEGLILSEVFYDRDGTDDGYEWIELFNSGTETIDLSSFSIAYGGTSYGSPTQLSGSVEPDETFVVGGTTSDSTNYDPTYDQSYNFSSDLQNSGSVGDGIALYNVPAASVTGSTVPIDAVIYGPNNDSNLIDETGSANSPEVGDAPDGSSIERTTVGGAWQIQSTPTPNSTGL